APGRAAVHVTVGADPRVDGITALRVGAQVGSLPAMTVTLPAPGGNAISIPPAQSFTLLLDPLHHGVVNLYVEALDVDENVLADGSVEGTVAASEVLELQVTLGSGGGGMDEDMMMKMEGDDLAGI